MNNKSLSSAPHTACFSSASCTNKYIKAWKVLFAKAVREEINSRHCHLMSCRELPVIMLPHIPLCVKKKKITLFNYFASVRHHPFWTTCTWKPASRNPSFASHKAVLSFIAPWEVTDARSVGYSSSKAKTHVVRVVFQGRLVYWTHSHGKADKIYLYKGCVSPQQWR